MDFIKIIIDHTRDKIFGQIIKELDNNNKPIFGIKEYIGFNKTTTEGLTAIQAGNLTIYDLRT
jgi:hypothetical protein